MSTDTLDADLLALVHGYLRSHPFGRRAADALEHDVATGGGPRPSAAQCPPHQLRRLLQRLAQGLPEKTSLFSAQAVCDEPRPSRRNRLPTALPDWLLSRETRGGKAARTLRRAPTAHTTNALLVGPERLGLRGVVEGHTNTAFCVAFDPTGQRVFTGADDGMVSRCACAVAGLPPAAALRVERHSHPAIRMLPATSDGTLPNHTTLAATIASCALVAPAG